MADEEPKVNGGAEGGEGTSKNAAKKQAKVSTAWRC